MSIVIHLYYTGSNGSAQAFAQEMESSGLAARIRQAEGCLRYDYFVSMSDPQTVLLVDGWTDQEAIDRHHATPMMAQILALREKYGLRARAERFVRDEGGVPAKDQAFLKP